MAEKLTQQVASTDKKVQDLSLSVAGNKFKKLVPIPDVLKAPTTENMYMFDSLITNIIDIGGPDWFDGQYNFNIEDETAFTIINTKDVLGTDFLEWHMFNVTVEDSASTLVTASYIQGNNISYHAYQDLKVMYLDSNGSFIEVKRNVRIVADGRLEIDIIPTNVGIYFIGIYSDSYIYSLGDLTDFKQMMDIREYNSTQRYIRYEENQVALENRNWLTYNGVNKPFTEEIALNHGYLYYVDIPSKTLADADSMKVFSNKMNTKCISVNTSGLDLYEASYFDTLNEYVYPAHASVKYIVLVDPIVDRTNISYTAYPSNTTVYLSTYNVIPTGTNAIVINGASVEDIKRIKVYGYTGNPNYTSGAIFIDPVYPANGVYYNANGGMFEYFTALDTGTKKGKEFIVAKFNCNIFYVFADSQPTITINDVAATCTLISGNRYSLNVTGNDTCKKIVSNVDITLQTVPYFTNTIVNMGTKYNPSGYASFIPSTNGNYKGTEFKFFFTSFGVESELYNHIVITYDFGTGATITRTGSDSAVVITSDKPIMVKVGSANTTAYSNTYNKLVAYEGGLTEIPLPSSELATPITMDNLKDKYVEIGVSDPTIYLGGPEGTPTATYVPNDDYNNVMAIKHNGYLYIEKVGITGAAGEGPYSIYLQKNGVTVTSKTIDLTQSTTEEFVLFNTELILDPADRVSIKGQYGIKIKEYTVASKTFTGGQYYTDFTDLSINEYGSISSNLISGSAVYNLKRLFHPTDEADTTQNEFMVGSNGSGETKVEIILDLKYGPLPFASVKLVSNETSTFRPNFVIISGYKNSNSTWTDLYNSTATFNTNINLSNQGLYDKYRVTLTKTGFNDMYLDRIRFNLSTSTYANWTHKYPSITVYGYSDDVENHNNVWTKVIDTNSTAVKTALVDWESENLTYYNSDVKCYLQFSNDNITWSAEVEKTNGQYITDTELGTNRYIKITLKLLNNDYSLPTVGDYRWIGDANIRYREVI